MKVKSLVTVLAMFVTITCGCKKSAAIAPPAAASNAAGAAAAPVGFVKVNKYGYAVFCDIAAGADGTLHAVFTDSPTYGTAPFLYYASSTDNGVTWTDPKNLSDDESGIAAGFCRVAVDGKGRVYAIWKYLMSNGLEGPGGNNGGEVCFRCLEGGTWSKTVRLNKVPQACFSYFVAPDAQGRPNVVWSQLAPDAAAQKFALIIATYADQVNQTVLDGGAMPVVRGVIVPAPLLSSDANPNPKNDGLYNLRGYIAPDGAPHFIGENVNDKTLRHFDGKTLTTIYTPSPAVSAPFNTFMEPAALLVDAAGIEHVIRMPEKPEIPCIRDYVVAEPISDPVAAIQVDDAGKGNVFDFSAFQGLGGHMVVLCGLSQTEKIWPKHEELYATASDGKQQWTAPVAITDNAHAASVTSGNGATVVNTYSPRFASLAFDKQGHACILFVSDQTSSFGVNARSVTSGGQAVQGMLTGGTSSTTVMFRRL